jgi:lipoate-protein ligase A
VHKKRVLHHGTLLFDSHLEDLKGVLKVDLSRFEDKAVQSNRSEVTNIANYLPQPISVDEFTRFIFGEISQNYPDFCVYELTAIDIQAIQKLSTEKYQTWDWIFGYSPRYRFTNKLETENGEIQVSLLVEKGKITEAKFSGAIQPEEASKMEEALVGCRHDFEEINDALDSLVEESISTIFKNKSGKLLF